MKNGTSLQILQTLKENENMTLYQNYFCERRRLSKWTQKELEDSDNPISIKEIEFAITLSTKKIPGLYLQS